MDITLTNDQALVLSDWLERVMGRPDFAAIVDDRAVWSPLLAISRGLDKQLTAIFDPAYVEKLEVARARLMDELGDFGRE
jgi:hypothetical protein